VTFTVSIAAGDNTESAGDVMICHCYYDVRLLHTEANKNDTHSEHIIFAIHYVY